MTLADSKRSPIGETPSALSLKRDSASGDESVLSSEGVFVYLLLLIIGIILVLWVTFHWWGCNDFEVHCENGCRLANGTIQYYTGINASCMRLFP